MNVLGTGWFKFYDWNFDFCTARPVARKMKNLLNVKWRKIWAVTAKKTTNSLILSSGAQHPVHRALLSGHEKLIRLDPITQKFIQTWPNSNVEYKNVSNPNVRIFDQNTDPTQNIFTWNYAEWILPKEFDYLSSVMFWRWVSVEPCSRCCFWKKRTRSVECGENSDRYPNSNPTRLDKINIRTRPDMCFK